MLLEGWVYQKSDRGSFFVGTENGNGASSEHSELSKKELKIWCVSISLSGVGILDSCCHSLEGFIELLERSPRERERNIFHFNSLSPDLSIYIPHIFAIAVSTLHVGSLRSFSLWNAANSPNIQKIFHTLDKHSLGVGGTKLFEQKFIGTTGMRVFS